MLELAGPVWRMLLHLSIIPTALADCSGDTGTHCGLAPLPQCNLGIVIWNRIDQLFPAVQLMLQVPVTQELLHKWYALKCCFTYAILGHLRTYYVTS